MLQDGSLASLQLLFSFCVCKYSCCVLGLELNGFLFTLMAIQPLDAACTTLFDQGFSHDMRHHGAIGMEMNFLTSSSWNLHSID